MRVDAVVGAGSGGSGSRIACLLVPDYLVALACRERPEFWGCPVVVGGAPEEHAEVRACSPEAASAGVVPGMTLRRALTLCRDAIFLPCREEEALGEARRIIALLRDHSPVVEAVEVGHVHFDVRGLAALARMEEEVYLGEILVAVRSLTDLPAVLGAGETVFAAHAAAVEASQPERRCGSERSGAANGLAGAEPSPKGGGLRIVREAEDFLAPLPVEVLPVQSAMYQRLRLLGIERLGQVAELPLSALQAQFGKAGVRAWRLARGEDDSVLAPRSEDQSVETEMDLPAPAITAGQLLAATRALLPRALNHQDVRGRSIRSVEWRLSLESGESIKRRATFREPTRDAARILFVLRGKIERLELPAAGIGAAISLSGFCSEYAHQGNLWGTGPKRRQELLDSIEQLNARTGESQVFRIVEVQPWSRIPERQLALAPYGP